MRQYRLKHFCINKYNLSEASTPTRGGDVFGKNSPNGHRFDSLGWTSPLRTTVGGSQRQRVAAAAPTNWAQINKGCSRGLPLQAGIHFHFARTFLLGLKTEPWQHRQGHESKASSRRPSGAYSRTLSEARSRRPERVTEQRLAQIFLHVVAPNWCTLEVVTWCNSLDCPFDCILYSWGR
jgi:hypothetical protein